MVSNLDEKKLLKITDLIKNNKIFSDIEKSFWLEILPYFSDKQKSDFYAIFFRESEKYRALRLEQIKQSSDLREKQLLEWKNVIRKENDKTSKFVQAKVKERDEKEIQSILDKLKNEQ